MEKKISSYKIKTEEKQAVNTTEFLLSKQEGNIIIKAEEGSVLEEEKEISPKVEEFAPGEGTTTSSLPKEIQLRKKENKLEKKKRKIAKLQAEIKTNREGNAQEVVPSKPLEIVFNPPRLEEEMKAILKKGDLKARNLQQQLEEVFFYRWQLKGAGQPEVLKHTQGITVFSRRITLEHRLVYSLSGNTLTIYAIEGHY